MTPNQSNQPYLTTYTIGAPGIPLVRVISAVGLFMNVYGVIHDCPVDPNIGNGELESGNNSVDTRFNADMMTFKMFLDDLSREYKSVRCTASGTTIGVRLTFTCE